MFSSKNVLKQNWAEILEIALHVLHKTKANAVFVSGFNSLVDNTLFKL